MSAVEWKTPRLVPDILFCSVAEMGRAIDTLYPNQGGTCQFGWIEY
jgi:hypothetical protein